MYSWLAARSRSVQTEPASEMSSHKNSHRKSSKHTLASLLEANLGDDVARVTLDLPLARAGRLRQVSRAAEEVNDSPNTKKIDTNASVTYSRF